MALQYSDAVNNARLDSVESTISTAPILRIRSGAAPADCATADSGTVLATLTLPSDWMAAASGASKVMAGTWEDTSGDANGTAAHFRIYDSGDTTCHMQGTITITSGGGDMEVNNTSIASGQPFEITTFTLNAGNQ